MKIYMNNDKCAPGITNNNGSCLTFEELYSMAIAYNSTSKTKKIIIDENDTNEQKKINIEKQFTEIFKNKCSNQQCWTKQSFMNQLDDSKLKNKIINHTFRPNGPQGKFEWLNTINIDKVMKQYENKYKNFKFLGAVPIDFDDLPTLGLCDIDCKKLEKQNKNIIGVVFNLDEHYKSGSHWVAMYANLNTGQLYYFDSYGTKPDVRIINFMKKIGKYCRKIKGIKHLDVNYNNIRYQYGNSECGVYSINFILRMLKNNNFEEIINNPISDDKINVCRKVYFNNNVKIDNYDYCE